MIHKIAKWCLLFLFTLVTQAHADCPRIISQSPYITHQLDYLGLKTCLVGSSRYNPELGLPTTGGLLDPDAHAIAELQADLWITSDWTKQRDFDAIQPTVKHALRLQSFGSMQQIEDNLMEVAKASGQPAALQKAQDFPAQWRRKAQEVRSLNPTSPKVLLISSCSGQPYAFGRDAFLSDLFTQMGFEIVGKPQRITHLPITPQQNALEALIAELQPQIVFIFERQLAPACQLMQLPKGTRIITLDGTHFLQPAPLLITAMQRFEQQWRRDDFGLRKLHDLHDKTLIKHQE
ncbi:ABC transporter substrate-binding protein [Thiomicrorhabdus cannonii]|uniref:ABC transporter substrate-binding protein n=1 Tax=Thiomicrorhabdus cannonii TaxID=2748011 RepID=UPI0015C1A70B|nr:ABC transporter substrate-binding protein [Thiomicrorhabdus cannonii]